MSRFGYLVALAFVAAPAAATEQPKTAASDENKLVCKRIAETGSLARAKKQCFTKAQWKKIDELSREQVRQMQTSVPGSSN